MNQGMILTNIRGCSDKALFAWGPLYGQDDSSKAQTLLLYKKDGPWHLFRVHPLGSLFGIDSYGNLVMDILTDLCLDVTKREPIDKELVSVIMSDLKTDLTFEKWEELNIWFDRLIVDQSPENLKVQSMPVDGDK